MKQLTQVIIMASLLSFFFNSEAQNKRAVFPPEKFSVFDAKLKNGKLAVGSFNMGYKNYNLKSNYPWCLVINIGLDLKHVTDNGLPIKSESDIANKLEDQLIKDIGKIVTLHYIGHIYNDTFLDVYAYTNDPEKVNEYLKREVNKKGLIRGFAYKIEKDINWEVVKPFIR